MPKIALYEPDIPQNTAAIIRTCACLGADLEIIEPCGFLLSDKRFKRVVMDYFNEEEIKFYQNSEHFFDEKKNERVVLMTTKASELTLILNLIKMIRYYLVEKVQVFQILCIKKFQIDLKYQWPRIKGL